MRNILVGLFTLAIGAAGCGAGQHGAEHGDDHEHGHEHEHEHGRAMEGPVGELHEVLAPVWHSEPGPGRVGKACAAAQTLRERASAVAAAPPAEGAGPEQAAAAKDLVAAGDALVAACAAEWKPEAEAKLAAFHEAFHRVAEAGGGEHHEHHD